MYVAFVEIVIGTQIRPYESLERYHGLLRAGILSALTRHGHCLHLRCQVMDTCGIHRKL